MGTRWYTAENYINNVVLVYTDKDACLIWPYSRNGSTGRAKFWLRGGKECEVSRFVCKRAHGPPPTKKHCSAHSCGNGHLGCVNSNHLRWATYSENEKDKLIHGTVGRGERNGFAKLSVDDVLLIRDLEGKSSRKELAKRFGVNHWYIRDIQKRRAWSWL